MGNKKKFLLKFSSNSIEPIYGKERKLRNSYWTGEGLTVEVNGEGKRRATWNHNKGGLKSLNGPQGVKGSMRWVLRTLMTHGLKKRQWWA